MALKGGNYVFWVTGTPTTTSVQTINDTTPSVVASMISSAATALSSTAAAMTMKDPHGKISVGVGGKAHSIC